MPDNFLNDYPQGKQNSNDSFKKQYNYMKAQENLAKYNKETAKAELALLKEKNKKPKEPKEFKSVGEAYQSLLQKGTQKVFKDEASRQYKKMQRQALLRQRLGMLAPISEVASGIAQIQQQSQKRQGIIRSMVGKAERMEQRFASINEVPFLHNMERARADTLTISNKWLEAQERSVTDSFPD